MKVSDDYHAKVQLWARHPPIVALPPEPAPVMDELLMQQVAERIPRNRLGGWYPSAPDGVPRQGLLITSLVCVFLRQSAADPAPSNSIDSATIPHSDSVGTGVPPAVRVI